MDSLFVLNKRKKGKKPQGLFSVNLNHPLAKDLHFVITEQSGVIRDVLKNVIVTRESVAKLGTTPFGRGSDHGVDTDSAYNIDKIITTSNGSGTGDFSILSYGNPPAVAASKYLLVQRYAVAPYPIIVMGANKRADGSTVSGYFAFSTHGPAPYLGIDTANAVDGKYHTYIGTRTGTAHKLYVDGVYKGATTLTVKDVTGSGSKLRIGSTADDDGLGSGADCNIGITIAWNRGLTAREARVVSADLGLLFEEANILQEDDIYSILFAEGASNPIAVNDAYDVTDGVQKVVAAPGILTNDTYICN